MVVDDDSTVTVKDAPARRQNRLGFDAVLLRPFAVELRVLHLQRPESGNQEQEDTHRHVLKHRDLARRKVRIVTQRGTFGNLLLFESGIDGGQDH